ncbi:MAG: CsbD family protein [Leifsonia sp.]
MSGTDKIKHAAEKATGKGKEAVGDVTGNEKLKAEGKIDQADANLKQAGEKVKDTLKGK